MVRITLLSIIASVTLVSANSLNALSESSNSLSALSESSKLKEPSGERPPNSPFDDNQRGAQCITEGFAKVCSKGWCWQRCDIKAAWSWLVDRRDMSWVKCNTLADCQWGGYLPWQCGGCHNCHDPCDNGGC